MGRLIKGIVLSRIILHGTDRGMIQGTIGLVVVLSESLSRESLYHKSLVMITSVTSNQQNWLLNQDQNLNMYIYIRLAEIVNK